MVKGHPPARPWSSGIFDCLSDGSTCCLGCCCPCCLAGDIGQKLGYDNTICCLADCVFISLLATAWVHLFFVVGLRNQYRVSRNIEGSVCEDVCCGICCSCCVLCQTAKECKSESFAHPPPGARFAPHQQPMYTHQPPPMQPYPAQAPSYATHPPPAPAVYAPGYAHTGQAPPPFVPAHHMPPSPPPNQGQAAYYGKQM